MGKNLRAFAWWSALLILWCSPCFSQQEYQDWLKHQQTSFNDFKDARDKAFSEFLQNEWRKMQLMQGISQDEKPKPLNAPVVAPETIVEPPPIAPLKLPPPPVVEFKPKPVPTPTPTQTGRPLRFQFFGRAIVLYLPAGIDALEWEGKPQAASIAGFWKSCSQSDYVPLIKQLVELRESLALNDWGHYWLMREMTRALWPDQPDRYRLLIWFLLNKSGYDARVGFDAESIHLLLTTGSNLYSRPYFVLNEKKYYLCDENTPAEAASAIYTYDSVYPGAEKALDMKLTQTPRLGEAVQEVKLDIPDPDSAFSVRVNINPNLIAFYRDYPQTDLSVYFKSPIAQEIMVQLAKALMPRLLKHTMPGALNLLLRFVQTAFVYKTDDQQFGREKPLFPEETLFYPASDCEDRSVLYAHLVRQLLGLEVVGLDYPGHVATAVRVDEKTPGDSVMVQNEKYLICDPTYINALIGQAMPKFQKLIPALIKL